MENTTESVRIRKVTKDRIAALAERDRRSLVEEIELLLEKALEREEDVPVKSR